jgi:hypothetical protein
VAPQILDVGARLWVLRFVAMAKKPGRDWIGSRGSPTAGPDAVE